MTEYLNETQSKIYKAAEGLFKLSTELKDINKEVSDKLLILSDTLLNDIETSIDSPSEEPTPKEKSLTPEMIKHMETCPDCGGYKVPDDKHLKSCPDCGGIKENLVQEIISEEDSSTDCRGHNAYSGRPQDENDPSTLCHGHTGDGSRSATINNPSPPSSTIRQQKVTPLKKVDHSEKVKTEIKSLIDEIRKGLK